MKLKESKKFIYIIILFMAFVIGTTNVNAVNINIYDGQTTGVVVSGIPTQESLDNIPDTINVDAQEIETDKASKQIYDLVVEELKNQQIEVENVNNSTEIDESKYTVYVSVNRNEADVRISLGYNTIVNKDVSVKYNNSNLYSNEDKKYIEDTLKNLGFVLGESGYSISSEGYYNVNNNTIVNKDDEILENIEKAGIVLKAVSAGGGIQYNGTEYDVYRNGIYYMTVVVESIYHFELTVPNSIDENKHVEYACDKLSEYLIKNFEEERTVTLKQVKDNVYSVLVNGQSYDDMQLVLKKEAAISREDKTTGVKLDTTTNTVSEDTVISVTNVESKEILNRVKVCLKDISDKYITYDINLLENGIKVQPNGKVKISIPIPDGFDKEKLEIYRITDSGEKISYQVTVEGNLATFETDHFSIYVLAENKSKVAVSNKQKDNTPKTGVVNITYAAILVGGVSGIGMLATTKKKKTKC